MFDWAIQQTPENTLSVSTVKATINAPIEKVDIAEWLLNLPDEEYQSCWTKHIGAGISSTYDGQSMSINVETIGDALMIQHYVAVIHRADYCCMSSVSDASYPQAGNGYYQLCKCNYHK
jgi:hypothetical protein